MTPARLPLLVAALLALPLLAHADGAPAPFHFQIPDGWRDFSPGVPEKNFEGMPASVVTEAKSGRYAAMAMDLDHITADFATNLNAIVSEGSVAINDHALTELIAGLSAEYAKAGITSTVVESGIKSVGAVPAAFVISDTKVGEIQMRQLAWFIPGDHQHAIITYSALPAHFAEYRPTFEKAALATTGAVAAPSFDWGSVAEKALIGAVVGAVIAGIAAMVRRRQAA